MSRGELLSVQRPGGAALIEYVHDPLGRRIAKKVGGAVVEKYQWSGMTQLLAVYDEDGTLRQRFEYAGGRLPISMTAGGARYYLGYDQVGSLRVVADDTGAVVKQIAYDSFGAVLSETNATFELPLGFAGGLRDADTGLTRFGFRDYDPEIGRWTAKDPIGFSGGDGNLYGYCWSDPVNGVDILGLVLATPEQGQALLDHAIEAWGGTTYKYKGSSHQGVDCSHLVNNVYNEQGMPYNYKPTSSFPGDNNPQLVPVTNPQVGDIVLFNGHMGLYAPNPPEGVPASHTLYGARGTDANPKPVGYTDPDWFSGTPTYYRYNFPDPQATPDATTPCVSCSSSGAAAR